MRGRRCVLPETAGDDPRRRCNHQGREGQFQSQSLACLTDFRTAANRCHNGCGVVAWGRARNASASRGAGALCAHHNRKYSSASIYGRNCERTRASLGEVGSFRQDDRLLRPDRCSYSARAWNFCRNFQWTTFFSGAGTEGNQACLMQTPAFSHLLSSFQKSLCEKSFSS